MKEVMEGLEDLDYNVTIKPREKVASPPKTIRVNKKSPMAPVKQRLQVILRTLEPVKFKVDEHVRDHWTLPPIFMKGMFEGVECKDAGLRVALNLAECFELGKVKWSGAPANLFQLKIDRQSEFLRSAINTAITGLQEMYKDFKTEFGNNEEERVT